MGGATMRLHALVVLTAMAGWATPSVVQTMISAKSGTINYIEGTVLIDQKPIEVKFAQFPQLNNKSLLQTTEEGRAEVLLADGIFLRLGENGAVRMLSNSLIDTRLELVSGSAVVEWADEDKHEPVTFTIKGSTVSLLKRGVYRLDSNPGLVQVYDGEARVDRDGQTVILKKARQLALEGVAIPEKFDNKTSDLLMRWARQRAGALSYANVVAAKDASRWGLTGGGTSGWVYNPWYGVFTYMPMSGIYNSFWGYSFFSPYSVWNYYYYPGRTYGGGGSRGTPVYSSAGHRGVSPTASGSSGTAAVSAPRSSSSSGSSSGGSSSPISHGSGHAGTPRGH